MLLAKQVCEAVSIPVVVHGGAGNMEHVLRAYWKAGVGLSTVNFCRVGNMVWHSFVPPPVGRMLNNAGEFSFRFPSAKTRFVEVAVSLISQQKTHTLKLVFLSYFRVQNSL